MKSIKSNLIILLVPICLVLAAQLNSARADDRAATLAQVYTVCNDSRISAEIDETQCGILQDESDTEFLCRANNMSPQNDCWVEDKR